MDEAAAPDGQPEKPGRAIVRAELREVIRRAAELSLNDADADEQLSEEEVIRIATELGLPAHHVQRALYELPELQTQLRWYDRYFGPAVISASRAVPAQSVTALRRLEDYLVTREYLQIVRKRGESLTLIPADDTLSSLARALTRPARRHIISRATRVMVGVHPLPDNTAHVRCDVDLTAARIEAVQTGATLGTIGGIITGAGAVATTVAILPDAMGLVPHVVAFTGTLLATTAAGIAIAANHFKSQIVQARLELHGLLDRLESGDRLEPPHAPWRRRLHVKLFGDRH
jgi:hypothetical protein